MPGDGRRSALKEMKAMTWYMRVALAWTVCLACTSSLVAQEPPTKPKAKIELRWLEDKRIEGLTEDKGIKVSCDPNGIAYRHKKPALALTAADIDEVSLKKHDWSASGIGILYSVTLHLKTETREKLAATCESNETRYLTIVVDNKSWGADRYEKDKSKPLIALECRAETFTPTIGYFSSETEAQRLVDAFK